MNYPLTRESVSPGVGSTPTLWEAPTGVASGKRSLIDLAADIREPLFILAEDQSLEIRPACAPGDPNGRTAPVVGVVPAVNPANLGDSGFCADYGLVYPYISGAMANGIGSVAIATALGKAGMLGFFGAAGLSPSRISEAIDQMKSQLGELSFGVNLIHAPQEPQWEETVVDLLLEKQVRLVEASAYLALTPAVVRYRVSGIHEDALGRIVAPNRIIAKVSRIEVATRFLSPPPEKILSKLVEQGHITQEQARLAARIPMAQDLTAEADSGGHTDNRPAIAMLPTMLALRDRIKQEQAYPFPLRIGLAGGISTPASAAAAFAMGAAFILVGTVNQACVESGTSDTVRAMLSQAEQADVAMAPAADMFEMGVNLQVLKRGTMFAMRAARLYHFYQNYSSLDALPEKDKATLEKTIFRASLEEIWQQTRQFFQDRDPVQVERAQRDPKHKMALVFRWYLGKASGWANSGDPERKVDYQVWCGPAMGAFNEWVRGSFLEAPENRRVVAIAMNILYGAAVLYRINSMRVQGYPVEPPQIVPQRIEQLKEFFS